MAIIIIFKEYEKAVGLDVADSDVVPVCVVLRSRFNWEEVGRLLWRIALS